MSRGLDKHIGKHTDNIIFLAVRGKNAQTRQHMIVRTPRRIKIQLNTTQRHCGKHTDGYAHDPSI